MTIFFSSNHFRRAAHAALVKSCLGDVYQEIHASHPIVAAKLDSIPLRVSSSGLLNGMEWGTEVMIFDEYL